MVRKNVEWIAPDEKSIALTQKILDMNDNILRVNAQIIDSLINPCFLIPPGKPDGEN